MDTTLKQVRRTLVYEAEADSDQIQQHIDQLRKMDKAAENWQRCGSFAAVGGSLLAAIGIGIGLATDFANSTAVAGCVGVGLLTLLAGILLRISQRKRNLDDRRYELLSQVLRLLSTDSAPEGLIRIRLDLRRPDAREKYARKGTAGIWDVKFYYDAWLDVQGRLLDGTSYSLGITEWTQHRSRWKTSASGKAKHKSKKKSATVALLRLKTKPAKYPNLKQFETKSAGAVQLPAWCSLKRIGVAEDALVLKVGAKTEWQVATTATPAGPCDGVQMVAMMFLSLYQILNLSRAVRKAGGDAAS